MAKQKKLSSDTALQILNKIPAFKLLDTHEKFFLSNISWCFLVYEKGDILTEEASIDRRMFILLSGLVKAIKGTKSKTLSHLNPGEIFGEISFLTDEPRTASIVAETTSTVLVIDQKLLDEVTIEIREKLKDQIIYSLVQHVKDMNNRFALGQLE